MSIEILALARVPPDRVAALNAAGYEVREGNKYASREEAVRAAGDSVRAVLTNGRGGLSAAEMALLPKLEIILATGAGYEAVDLAAARERGIVVCNNPDANATAVADHAMMLLLAAVRHLRQADRHVANGGWQDQWRVDTSIIFGKRLGIFGMGTIGSKIAYRAARGFDMDVGYHNRKPVAASPHRYFDDLVALAEWADFLVSAAPGGAGTRHKIDARVIAALGPRGYLVNTGRGTIVDTAALIDALKAKRIGGAGLDVLEGEPATPPLALELQQFDNVIVTPHFAGRAPESRIAGTAMLIEHLSAHFSGRPVRTAIFRSS